MKRNAQVEWQGDGPTGSGKITTQSGALQMQPFSAELRFQNENGKAGTNPEELIGAAHASCYTMALAFALHAAGFKADVLHTTADVEIIKIDNGFWINEIRLKLQAKTPNIDKAKFYELAQSAKMNCPVSKALAGTNISLDAELLK